MSDIEIRCKACGDRVADVTMQVVWSGGETSHVHLAGCGHELGCEAALAIATAKCRSLGTIGETETLGLPKACAPLR